MAAESTDALKISNLQSFSRAMHARYAEYTSTQKLKIKIGSWNIAARPRTESDLTAWFVQGKRSFDERAKKSDGEISDTSEERVADELKQGGSEKREKNYTRKSHESIDNNEEEIGIYVLGLQEVVRLNTAREYIGRIYNDPEPVSRWRNALVEALPSGYIQIVEQQLSGMLLFIYASPSIAPMISSVSSFTIGTGLMGYLGNKGAIASRIVLAETTRLVFINSHLSSGADPPQLQRRFWDVGQILQKTIFEPIKSDGHSVNTHERIGDEDFAFWFGDLNFRLGLPGEEIRRLLTLMMKGQFNREQSSQHSIEDEIGEDETFILHIESDDNDEEYESKTKPRMPIEENNREDAQSQISDSFILDPSQDPASLQSTLNCLLPHDQLKHSQSTKKIFHDGWNEGPITFLPTYKYDIGGEGAFDTSEKKRAPSWCDRILYRTRRDKIKYDEKCRKEESLHLETNSEAIAQETEDTEDNRDSIFDYNPDEDEPVKKEYHNFQDEAENDENGQMMNDESIKQEIYTSHQQVISSDHKPIHATFTLSYDIIIPELKAKVRQELARDLDKAENEGRPGVTIVIDHSLEKFSPGSLDVVTDAVDFGQVAYNQKITQNLTVANTGRVPATVRFIDKQGLLEENCSKESQWLSFYFYDSETSKDGKLTETMKKNVTLEPGDAINAALVLLVQDIELVRALNRKSIHLEDILVLRVTDGRDFFISVRGCWLQTCLGRSIDELVRVPEGGVRNISSLKPNNDSVGLGQDLHCSTPRELYKLTEAVQSLTERVIADSNILENAGLPQNASGWPFNSEHWLYKDSHTRNMHKQLIIEALDTGQNLHDVFAPEILAIERLEVVSEVLLIFLSCLSDGIVTVDLWSSLENSYANRGTSPEEIKTWALDILSASPNHNISFVFLMSMLAQVTTELAPVIFNSDSNSSNSNISISGSPNLATAIPKQTSNVVVIDSAIRRSLSWRMKAPISSSSSVAALPSFPTSQSTQVPYPMLIKREIIAKGMTEVFTPIIFRDIIGMKDREKKAVDEKRRAILQSFISHP
ncbi:putative phosphatase family protein [Golovinomyces cichoracearum]|uniref:Putative phosphatase family protein n=1 Tax=Golovinomyces cichoracearum TaxID=62708 RepID=A0A420HFS5_9PEZI|nr:putative phosphatase family protein [Golovinomyces cichoracearum]